MPDSPSPPTPQSQAPRLAAMYGRATSSAPAPSSAAPAPAPAAAPAGSAPVYFSKAEEKLAQRYARLDAARRSPPASSAPPVPPPAPAPPAGDGTPPAAGTGAAPAPAPDAPLELDVPAGLDAADPLLTELKASGAKLGLDREKAGKVLELHQRVQAAQDAQLAAMHEGWQRAARADEEIGGDGSVIAA